MSCCISTKYLNGHSDMIGGAIVIGDNSELGEKLAFCTTPWVPGSRSTPSELRGLKTLPLRMARHARARLPSRSGLYGTTRSSACITPLPSHPQHALARRQMNGFGGMVTLVLRGGPMMRAAFSNGCRFLLRGKSGRRKVSPSIWHHDARFVAAGNEAIWASMTAWCDCPWASKTSTT
jgi:cystathionine gamma-lyase